MRLWVVYMGNDRQVRCPLLMEFLLSTEKLAPFLPQQEMSADAKEKKCSEPERVRRETLVTLLPAVVGCDPRECDSHCDYEL